MISLDLSANYTIGRHTCGPKHAEATKHDATQAPSGNNCFNRSSDLAETPLLADSGPFTRTSADSPPMRTDIPLKLRFAANPLSNHPPTLNVAATSRIPSPMPAPEHPHRHSRVPPPMPGRSARAHSPFAYLPPTTVRAPCREGRGRAAGGYSTCSHPQATELRAIRRRARAKAGEVEVTRRQSGGERQCVLCVRTCTLATFGLDHFSIPVLSMSRANKSNVSPRIAG